MKVKLRTELKIEYKSSENLKTTERVNTFNINLNFLVVNFSNKEKYNLEVRGLGFPCVNKMFKSF